MKTVFSIFSLFFCFISAFPLVGAEQSTKTNPPATKANPPEANLPVKSAQTPFEPFTGKISKNKVRLRLQPTYDGQILREMQLGDMVVVLGENEDFFAVQPPSDFKAYVYRTFVLDNVVEGSRVNVRLSPDLDAPVIAQLNSGDSVNGTIVANQSKWLAIEMPQQARFFIAKDFVNKIGDAQLMARLEKKGEEVNRLLKTTEAISQNELAKPFNEIHIDGIKNTYEHIVYDYPEFPEVSEKAKTLLASLQEVYTQKKLAYLETQSNKASTHSKVNEKLSEELNAHKSKIAYLEQQIADQRQTSSLVIPQESKKPSDLPLHMSAWIPTEDIYFQAWADVSGNYSIEAFYDQQKQEAFILRGTIDTYNRPVKNKPGDFMLVNSSSRLPIAFLYSTQINLQDHVGHEVSILVSPRPNNHFAFPAYYVLSFE